MQNNGVKTPQNSTPPTPRPAARRHPRLVPRKTIEALADQIIAEHPGDPEGWAFRAEETAWLRGQMFEQGQWHRVRRTIRKRRLTTPPNL